jgi:RimJ/RimL family protein N-acetyltransferase
MPNKLIGRKTEADFLKGRRVMLRPLALRDINRRYLAWLNDQEVTAYLETGVFPTDMRELKNFYKKISNSKTDMMFAIIDKRTDLHIGNIKLGAINWVHRYADMGIMIGEKRYWGRGYGGEALGLVLGYAFKRLNLNKVILGVYSNHRRAIGMYEKAGFHIEGRIKKLLRSEGRYVDKIFMGISQRDFLKTKAGLR